MKLGLQENLVKSGFVSGGSCREMVPNVKSQLHTVTHLKKLTLSLLSFIIRQNDYRDIKAHFGNFLYLIKLAIGSINDIYETLTRFFSMKHCKSDIIR